MKIQGDTSKTTRTEQDYIIILKFFNKPNFVIYW